MKSERIRMTRPNRRQFVAALAACAAAAPSIRRAAAQGTATPASTPSASGAREIEHAMGTTEVPADPQRIVVLDGPMLDAALSVGIKPVGAPTAMADQPFPPYLGDGTEGIVNIGTIQEPDLERIIELEPDLILGMQFRHEAIYEQLSQIAPTVFGGIVGAGWQRDFLLFTDAMNRIPERDKVLADYKARIEDFKDATADSRADWRISVVRFREGGVRVYYKSSFVGIVLSDLDLPRPAAQDKGTDEERFTEISPERISECDGTHMFTCSYGDPAKTDLSSYVDNPLWQTLQAVRENHVYWVDDDYWMVGIGYIAANLVIDDLTAYLVDNAEPTPLPV